MSLGEMIRDLRLKRKMSQDEFGERLGINGRNVSRYENNRVRPRVKMLEKMAQVLGVPAQEFQDLLAPEPLEDDPELREYIAQIPSLDPEDRLVVKRFLRAIVTNKRLLKVLAS